MPRSRADSFLGRAPGPESLLVKGPVTGVVVTDVDGDLDVDLLVLLDGQPPVAVLNDRLFRFHRGESDRRVRPELERRPRARRQRRRPVRPRAPRPVRPRRGSSSANGMNPARPYVRSRFGPGVTDSPPLRSAAWFDLDLDGRTDIVGLSADRKPVFLQGDGAGKFAKKNTPFGPERGAIADLLAVVRRGPRRRRQPDLFAWSAASGLARLPQSAGTGTLRLRVTRHRKRATRASRYGRTPTAIGCLGRGSTPARSGPPPRTRRCSPASGSRACRSHFGLGKARARGRGSCSLAGRGHPGRAERTRPGLVSVVENDRKPTSRARSCSTWDGERFVFVTDFLGAGSVGEHGPGRHRPARRGRRSRSRSRPASSPPGTASTSSRSPSRWTRLCTSTTCGSTSIDHPAGVGRLPRRAVRHVRPAADPGTARLPRPDGSSRRRPTDHRGRDVTGDAPRARPAGTSDGFAPALAGSGSPRTIPSSSTSATADRLPPAAQGVPRPGRVDRLPVPRVDLRRRRRPGCRSVSPVLERLAADGKTWETARRPRLPGRAAAGDDRATCRTLKPGPCAAPHPHQHAGLLGPGVPRAGRGRSGSVGARLARRVAGRPRGTAGSCRSLPGRPAADRLRRRKTEAGRRDHAGRAS